MRGHKTKMGLGRKILILIVVWLAILAAVILRVPSLKDLVKAAPRKVGLTLLPADRISCRRYIVAALDKSLKQRQFEQAAFLNSLLAQEAFNRAYRALKAWEKMRDPETGLLPKATSAEMAYWDAEDTASDLFPFLLLANQYLDKDNEGLWLKSLAKEREISGVMPCKIGFRPTRVIERGSIFGAAEYAKDGLLTITERLGKGPWSVRLEEIMHALIDSAQVETKSGRLCSDSSEVNGNMLQVLSRLYWMTEKDGYLKMAERIAEAYLFEIFPKNQYLPVLYWDFPKGEPKSPKFRLRDHGSEIIAGLTELYLLEKAKGRVQAARYREPLKKCLDRILVVGRTEDGLWYNEIDTNTYKPINKGVVDTWGYILNAYQTFDIVEGSHIYTEEIKRTMLAAASHKSFPWQGQAQDGYADSIESMLYLLPWFDILECRQWVDDEIEIMFSKQFPSGFVEEIYLDGNFIRTALLYATYKTQGLLTYPWREDVRVGAAYDKKNKELYLYLSADNPWRGILRFDLPRHRIIWNLRFNYPRLNATPEWFVVEPQKSYAIVNLDNGEVSSSSGQSLAEGLGITLDRERPSVYLKVSKE